MKTAKILLVTALSGFLTVNSFCRTWTQTRAPNGYWDSIASSADGNKLAAGAYGKIYTSTNAGLAWTTNNNSPSTYLWTSVASSADGSVLIAAAGYPVMGPIYTSTNSGMTWISNNLPNEMWHSVASSADGTKLIAASINGGNFPNGIYTSTNYGTTWVSNNAPSGFWWSVTTSADGNRLVAALDGGGIYTNSGINWDLCPAPITNWSSVASSADGVKLAAVVENFSQSPIYVSTNGGATWSNVGKRSTASLTSVVSSADGTKLATCDGYLIYDSTNSGADWENGGALNKQWYALASSADGTKLFATVLNGGIWISQTIPTLLMDIETPIGDLTLSWVVPPTNFILQQSYDLSSWTDFTNPPIFNPANSQNEVKFPAPGGTGRFYRLRAE